MSDVATADVLVLDIRTDGPDRDELDRLTRDDMSVTWSDRIVVVDDTSAVVANDGRYQGLARLDLRGLVCVVVGRVGDEAGDVALRLPAALGAVAVTLWVGSETGIRWIGGTTHGKPAVDATGAGLSDLLAALSAPEVFDEVFAQLRAMPYQTACPGLGVVRSSIGAAELTSLHLHVLHDVAGDGTAVGGPLAELAGPDRSDPAWHAGGDRPAITVGSGLDIARKGVRAQLTTVEGLTRRLGSVGGMAMVSGRVVARDVTVLGRRIAALTERVGVVLRLIDQRAAGSPTADRELAGIGVPPVDSGKRSGLAAQVRDLLIRRLLAGESLSGLAFLLQQLANQQTPQNSTGHRRLANLPGRNLDRLTSPAGVPNWPAPFAMILSVAVACTLVCGWLSAIGVVVGAAWLGLNAVLVARQPAAVRAPGGWPTLAAMAAGVVAAVVGGFELRGVVRPPAVPWVLVGVAGVLVAVVVTDVGWRSMITRWVRGLDLAAARSAHTALDSIVDDAIADQSRLLDRRRRLADAALLLKSGLTDVSAVYLARAASDRTIGDTTPAGVSAELYEVLRHDAAVLAVHSLDRYLTDVAGRPELTVDSAVVKAQTGRYLDEYLRHLTSRSILSQPDLVDDRTPRAALSAALWQKSDQARDFLLGNGRGELVQLCRPADLRLLNSDWTGVDVLRFAPTHVQQIVLGAVEHGITAIEIDLAGILRLVPVLPGRVAIVQPTHSDPNPILMPGNAGSAAGGSP